jgi:MFS family permease
MPDEENMAAYKWELIALLWFAFLFNMADRQAYNIVLPLLSKDLGLTPVHAGLVASIFLWFYAALVPVGGFLGDIARRKWVIFGSLLLWSVGTILSGFTTGLIGLIIFRSIATGGGEAFYFPSANSLIGQHHHKTRALAMSIHQTALYVGIIASGFVAGWLGKQFGWRSAFLAFGAVGVILALLIGWRMRDDPQPLQTAVREKVPRRELLRAIAGKPTVWSLWVAFGFFYFTQIGYITWMPTFLYEKFHLSLPTRGSPRCSTTTSLRPWASCSAAKSPTCWPCGAAPSASKRSSPACCSVRRSSSDGRDGQLLALLLRPRRIRPLRGVYDSNLYAVLFDVIEPRYRSSAVGLMLSFVFFVSAFAPVALGWAKTTIGSPPPCPRSPSRM